MQTPSTTDTNCEEHWFRFRLACTKLSWLSQLVKVRSSFLRILLAFFVVFGGKGRPGALPVTRARSIQSDSVKPL